MTPRTPHRTSVRLPDLPDDPGDALSEVRDRLAALVAHLAGSSEVHTETYAADCAVVEAWVDADGFTWWVSLTVEDVEDELPPVWELETSVHGTPPPPSPAAARWARHGVPLSFAAWVGLLAVPIVPMLTTRPPGDLGGIALVVGGVFVASIGAVVTAGVVEQLAYPRPRTPTAAPIVQSDWFAEVEEAVDQVGSAVGLTPRTSQAQP